MKATVKRKLPQWAALCGSLALLAVVIQPPLARLRGEGFLIASTDSASSTSYSSGQSTSRSDSSRSTSISNSSSSSQSIVSSTSSISSSASTGWSYEEYLRWLELQKSSSSKKVSSPSSKSSSSYKEEDDHSSLPAVNHILSSVSTVVSSFSLQSVPVSEGANRSEVEELKPPVVVSSSSAISTPDPGNLGCFTREGSWTQDRTACAEDQEKYVREQAEKENVADVLPVAPDVPEEIVQERLDEYFQKDDELNRKTSELAQSIEAMRIRLESILGSTSLSDATRNYIANSIQWLLDGLGYFASGDRTIEEIERMAQTMKDVLEKVKELIEAERVPLPTADIRPIVQRTELLLKKFRQSFIELTQAGIPVNQDAIVTYVNAQSHFDAIMQPCLDDQRDCDKLSEVLDLLKKAEGPLREAMDAHPEIQLKVEQMFQ